MQKSNSNLSDNVSVFDLLESSEKTSDSRRARLTRDVQRLVVNISFVQETRFSIRDREYILSKRFVLYSSYIDRRSRGVSMMVSKNLDAGCILIFVDRLDLAADRNVIDPKIDNKRTKSVINNRDVKLFRNLIDKFDCVDKYRNETLGRQCEFG